MTVVVLALPLHAQSANQCAALAGNARDSAGARGKPVVVLQATVHMRELRFDSQPSADVSFLGCPGLDTLIVTRRENLPKPVVPGVTYRDVTVAIELRSWLGLQCLQGGGAKGADSTSVGSLYSAICQAVGARDSTVNRRRNNNR